MSAAPEILVVEDHVLLHRPLRRTLDRSGYTPTLVTEASEALTRLADPSCAFALLLIDIELPGGGFHDVVQAFTARFPDAPVVVCSGYPYERAGLGEEPQGRFHYLAKPFEGPELADMVGDCLGRAP